MINILIVDDHTIIREGLEKIIHQESDMKVVSKSKNANEAIRFLLTKKVNIVILDISLPGKNGIDLIHDIKHIQPNLGIIILSMYPEERFALKALKSGASSYLTKELAAEEIVNAIRKVNTGNKYITPTVAELIADEFLQPASDSIHERLSNREYDVMNRIALGKSIKEIASEMSLSGNTISTYRARILKKLNMKNTAQIIHYCLSNSLVE